MGKTRRFIDKKNAVTYHLVHRSQRDPLAADADAPQRVFKQIEDSNKRLEEQRKYGVFYEDDYDYMQHLRDVNDTQHLLPATVMESDTMEDVGLLNRAAPHTGPRLDMDPDIVAALDDDFDFGDPDNELEDDFIALANEGAYNEEEEEEHSDVDSMEDMMDRWGDESQMSEEETRSRYSSYSLSSSVLPRCDKLQLLDEQFDKLLESYEDDRLGAIEEDEEEGGLDPNCKRLIEMAEEFNKRRAAEEEEECADDLYIPSDSDQEEELETIVVEEKKREYDCESILSTYSNLYNHPKLIPYQPIKISHKTGIPLNVHKRGLTKEALAALDSEVRGQDDTESHISRRSTLTVLSTREKDETPEQRKARKNALKEYRRERREEKKTNTTAFKEEKKKQEKQMINVRRNLQGVKIA